MTNSLTNPVKVIESSTLKQWLDRNQATLVDVRERAEYAGEHIPTAVLMPLSFFDPKQIPINPAKKLVFYCQSSNRNLTGVKQRSKNR